jgi:hypothetical protein
MYWYYLMICLVLCGVAISLESHEKIRRYFEILFFPSVISILAVFVGLRSSSPDYDNYTDWFNWVSAGHLVAQDWEKDPAFVLVSLIVSSLGITFIGVALFFAIAALVSQFYFSKLASDQRLITLLFFLVVCRTFVGSDMASIRSAVAIPLMSSSILLAFRGRKRIALLLYVAGLTFHLSALIGLLPFFLAMLNVRFSSRWWILSIAAAAVLTKISLEHVIEVLSYGSRTSMYVDTMIAGKGPPLAYLAYIAARVLLLGLVLMFSWNKITPESRMVLFCYSIGIFVQIVFIFNNALSWRGSDIFGLFDMCVLLIPLKHLTGKARFAYTGGLVVLGLLFFCSGLPILEPYRWVLA